MGIYLPIVSQFWSRFHHKKLTLSYYIYFQIKKKLLTLHMQYLYVFMLVSILCNLFVIIAIYYLLFLFCHYIMSWLKANRVSAKQPVNSSYNIGSKYIITPKTKSPQNTDISTPDKIQSYPSFSLEKMNHKTIQSPKSTLSTILQPKQKFKLPALKKRNNSNLNPQDNKINTQPKDIFYQTLIYKALDCFQTTYMMTLARQHFYQTVEALRLTRNFRVPAPKKQIKLEKKSPHKKTIYLDLDQTLIHTDEKSSSYTVLLTFPIQTGGSIQAGVRIRPHCKQFLMELAKIAQVIIFTASSSSYANVILDHLDPENKLFDHRLYRNHCTLERGFFVKDLRCVNRNLQDVAIVDNSAFSFLLQPENGIPIIPFYHFAKDSQLLSLLQFLKEIIQEQDIRNSLKKYFFFDAYLKDSGDPKKIFQKRFKKQFY